MGYDAWERRLSELVERAGAEWLTPAMMTAELTSLVQAAGSPIRGALLHIELPGELEDLQVGVRGDGDESERREIALDRGLVAHVSTWRAETAVPLEASSKLEDLAARYAAAEHRFEVSGLLRFPMSGQQPRMDRTIQRIVEEHGAATLMYADLDRFKEVNDQHGKAAGDKALARVGLILSQVAGVDGLAIHNSGDEYSLLYPGLPADALAAGREVAQKLRDTEFEFEANLGITFGAVPVSGRALPVYSDLMTVAEEATKQEAGDEGEKEKRRGRMSLATRPQTRDLAGSLNDRLDRALITVKSLAMDRRPFQDVWLNFVSSEAEKVFSSEGADPMADEMATLALWVAPDWGEECSAAASVGSYNDEIPKWSRIDFCLAVAHGVLRSALLAGSTWDDEGPQLTLKYSESAACSLLLDDQVLVELDGVGTASYLIGGLIGRTFDVDPDDADSRCAVLVRIGHGVRDLPPVFFEEVIVDDRPTAGGGLPDFWEATLARVIAAANRTPNLSFLGVAGSADYAAETLARLSDISNWHQAETAWELAQRTATTPNRVVIASQRLGSALHVCSSTRELFAALTDHMRPARVVGSAAHLEPDAPFVPISREWTAKELERRDGFTVETLAEAYPLILQILSNTRDDDFQIVDNAGVQMVDLRDVKVVLTRPTSDRVPAFFADREDSMQQYFTSTFLGDHGRFAKAMGEQIDRVVAHLADAISAGGRFSTRRANIVLPHDLDASQSPDLSPLGLVSLRCIPRYVGRRVVLHFSFTWRTVEALIGFPYSAYGSVSFADHLCQRIAAEVQGTMGDDAPPIVISDVSYIAHSLHMATDAYGRAIAKKIIAG